MFIELEKDKDVNEIMIKKLYEYFIIFLRHECINKNIKQKDFVNDMNNLGVCIEVMNEYRHKKLGVSRETIYDYVVIKNKYIIIEEFKAEYEEYYLL